MTERPRTDYYNQQQTSKKMDSDLLSPRKTMLVLVIVVGCFAVLWPKVFYPMLLGTAQSHLKPSPIDRTTGCCDVISETDVNTIKLISELCDTIIKGDGKEEKVKKCKREILKTCGIDVSVILKDDIHLDQDIKRILDEIRSLNGSLCLKYNFGVAPWKLGVPHRILNVPSIANVRQERPLQLRSELIHPAFRERGRAIPHSQPSLRPITKVIDGRPGPIPGLRPTIGGAGHVVPPSKQGGGSMSIIMPIYTIGIVIFFTYTLMKVVFKKQPEGIGGNLYPPIAPDPRFRREVFESDNTRIMANSRVKDSSKIVVNAMSALLDEVDQELEARRKFSEGFYNQDLANGNIQHGKEDQPRVTVIGMEMRASCENGQKWTRPDLPLLPTTPQKDTQQMPPPQEIFLEGTLPPQSHLLVTDSAIESESNQEDNSDPAVVLAGKMTLSVISLDSSETGTENGSSDFENIGIEAVEPDQELEAKDGEENVETLPEEDVFKEKMENLLEQLNELNKPIQEEIKLIEEKLESIPQVKESEKSMEQTLMDNLEKQIRQQEALLMQDSDEEEMDEPERVVLEEAKEVINEIEAETDEEDLNDEEEVEIEEIVYESDSDEEIEENEVRNGGINGDESKNVTISETAAENDVSEEETDEEEVEDEEVIDEQDINHVAD